MKQLWFFILGSVLTAPAFANICGTDYQNFNPTTNGLDFVTVQSSETLKPCIYNMGLFFNYAANSLTYSRTLNAGYQKGQKAHDRTLGADLSIGTGITKRWDVGVNVPVILSQKVEDDYYVSSYDETGITEIKLNTKYKLLGDDNHGLAVIGSVNKNLIEDNPFAGKGAGPTWNLELAADTTLSSKWALGINGGYRSRDPGDQVAGSPFVPMDDQWIYSGAASYLIASMDTKIIAEVYGSHVAKTSKLDSDRSLNSLEGLIGAKYDATTSLALHGGFAAQIDDSLGGPDWRIYAGMNWAIGAGCDDDKSAAIVAAVPPEENKTEEFKLDAELVFGWNSDQVDPARLEDFDKAFTPVLSRKFKHIIVEGHTDSVGNEAYNMDLSQRRANNVKAMLVDRFKLKPDSVEAVGYGPTRPIADNGNYQGRRKNRRVELKIVR